MTLESRRRGVTLVELLIGLAVALLVTLMAVSQAIRHRQAYDAISAELDLRARLRDASDIIAADLRGTSSVGDTIVLASDTAVEFYSAIGASTICTVVSPVRITLPPDTLASGRTLSAWIMTPDTGDYVSVFGDSSSLALAGWTRARITSFVTTPTSTGCPAAAGLLGPADVGAPRSYDLSVASPIPGNVRRGSPVRFVRRVRYDIYRGGDGKWYVGYRRCAAVCSPVQPVSGPYESSVGRPLTLRYFTRAGSLVAGSGPSNDVARVEIVSRATSARQSRVPGLQLQTTDSAVVTVALRNRR